MTTERKQINFTIVPDDSGDLPRTYANFCAISHTPFDFTLSFCEVLPLSEKDIQAAEADHVIQAPVRAKMWCRSQVVPNLIAALQEHMRVSRRVDRQQLGQGSGPLTSTSSPRARLSGPSRHQPNPSSCAFRTGMTGEALVLVTPCDRPDADAAAAAGRPLRRPSAAAVPARAAALPRSGEDARDLVQETFLRAARSPHRAARAPHEEAWLVRVLINICRDRGARWRSGVCITRRLDAPPGRVDPESALIARSLIWQALEPIAATAASDSRPLRARRLGHPGHRPAARRHGGDRALAPVGRPARAGSRLIDWRPLMKTWLTGCARAIPFDAIPACRTTSPRRAPPRRAGSVRAAAAPARMARAADAWSGPSRC